jgi:hypothetical protein
MKTLLFASMAALLLTGCGKKDDPVAKQQNFDVKVNYKITNVESPYSAEVISEADPLSGQGTYSAERYSLSGHTVTGTETVTHEMTATNQAGRTITFTVAINGPWSSTTPPPLPASAVVSAEVMVNGTVKKTFLVNSSNAPDSYGKRMVNYRLTL